MADFNYIHKKTTELLPNRFYGFCFSCNGNCHSCTGKSNYSADFGQAQSNVAISEGGYQANPKDTGNYTGGVLVGTNYGISAPVLTTYLGRQATVSDMQNLSYSTALAIYKRNYWDNLDLDNVNNQDLAYLIYDTSVNMGSGFAKQAVTGNLNGLSYSSANINSQDATTLFNAVKQTRYDRYVAIGGGFLQSWLNRLNGI